MAIDIKTPNQILGNMIRRIIADTPANDIATGSVLLTILEAAATSDFENNASILNILELFNIDAVKNTDLDNRGADYGLVRKQAIKSSGFVTVGDSNITKRTASLYLIKPAPIAGNTVLYVNDASTWSASGSLYIGRGTKSFEGPIAYSSITNFGSYFALNLSSSLQNDHLLSDSVVDAQGTTDRLIAAGTVIKIPANNQNPEIEYTTIRDAIVAAGEDHVDDVEVIAIRPGSFANAGVNTITLFNSLPFAGATVANADAFTNGRDVESDANFRNRIKAYSGSLARGTEAAILSAIIGLSDIDENKQIVSAVVKDPVSADEPSIIYIDDGTGLQPSFSGQSVDVLIKSATGTEEFLQLANYPLPRPQVVNTVDGPYVLTNGYELRVLVDGAEEVVTFTTDQFLNISAATAPEIVAAINNQTELFKCRLTSVSQRLLIYPVESSAETIQVIDSRTQEEELVSANNAIKFPTNEFSYIRLYKNNELLIENARKATVTSNLFSTWNIATSGSIIMIVDGTPSQDRTFTSADFDGIPFNALNLDNWVEVFNTKFAGITAVATSSGQMQITSNKTNGGSLEISSGSYFSNMFDGVDVTSVGKASGFELNRQNGNVRVFDIDPEDSITAGSEDAKGAIVSELSTSGAFNVDVDASSRPAEIVVVSDASRVEPRTLDLTTATVITISDQGSNVMRVMSSGLDEFATIQPLDFIYIANRGDINGTGAGPWLDIKDCGVYQVFRKGEHTSASVNSYVDVKNVDIIVGSYTVLDTEDIKAFYSDEYPQIWSGTLVGTPAAEPIQGIVDSINESLVNVVASVFKTNYIKLTSTTEEGGSIAIPVSVGNAKNVFIGDTGEEAGNPSHIANRRTSRDMATFFRRTAPTNVNVWLDRYTYTDVDDAVTASVEPGIEGFDPYSEEIESLGNFSSSNISYEDILNFYRGNNKGLFRVLKEIIDNDSVGTQFGQPLTVFDHIVGDRLDVMKTLEIADQDKVVAIIDQDSTLKTINVPFSRTGKVNSGSQSLIFLPTTTSFSADDKDNDVGVDFGTLSTWSKTLNNTEFEDYAMWMRARNWYAAGGAGSGGGTFLVRHTIYGPTGENNRFRIEYPDAPLLSNSVYHENTPTNTLTTYVFGSGTERTISPLASTKFSVTSLGSYVFRYTAIQTPPMDLSTVVPNDIVSISSASSVSAANRGVFRIQAVSDVFKTFDVYNPDGVVTIAGSPEITGATFGADVVGTPEITDFTTVPDVANSLHQTFFTVYDQFGAVGIWYDLNNSGAAAPSMPGTYRAIKVATLITGDSAITVAAKTAAVVTADAQFTASSVGSALTITDNFNGNRTNATINTTGFTLGVIIDGTPDAGYDGKYFIVYDKDGSVAVWYDVDNNGTPEPAHGAARSIAVTTVVTGDSANTVATKTSVVINADAQFIVPLPGANVISITDAENGNRAAPSAGTCSTVSGFSISTTTNGIDDTYEYLGLATAIKMYPLASTSVSNIVSKINESDNAMAVTVGSGVLNIVKATRDEVYVPAGPTDYSVSLAFSHDPNPLNNLHDFVSLHDGENWVLSFSNSNPNFVAKKEFTLNGIVPLIYAMDTCPNSDSADTGEFLRLVPRTIANVHHQLTHKALAQLSLVSNIDISDFNKKVQLKSKLLGSQGAIEVVSGTANEATYSVIGESSIVTEGGTDYINAKIQAQPIAINDGDTVKISSLSGTPRLSRLTDAHSMDTEEVSNDNFEYRYNATETNINRYVKIAITDVSGTYGRPAGTVWRWTHNDAGSTVDITDENNGNVATRPNDYQANGTANAAALEFDDIEDGTASLPQNFKLTVNALPVQADYFTFNSQSGLDYAAWFDIDANGTQPTGGTFTSVAVARRIQISILSTDSPNQIVAKINNALNLNIPFTGDFDSIVTQGALLSNVSEGDLLSAYGSLSSTWNHTNRITEGDVDKMAGYPIIAVNSASKYIDIVNPYGAAMSSTLIADGTVAINPTPMLKWHLAHSARSLLTLVTVSSGTATATTSGPHRMTAGDTFSLLDNTATPSVPGASIGTVVSILGFNQFTYATAAANGSYTGGSILKVGKTLTRYKIEKLGFNNLVKLTYVVGDSPRFIDCGVAIDDILKITGNTFRSANAGEFRVLGVTNASLIYENSTSSEEVNLLLPFNNLEIKVTWTTNSAIITGVAGSFKNLTLGDWVKKAEDDDTYYNQVIGFDTGFASTATIVTIGGVYRGTGAEATGVTYDQLNDVEQGLSLLSYDDIVVFEGDSARPGDSLIVSAIADIDWFNSSNAGNFDIVAIGQDASSNKPYVRIVNSAGTEQQGIAMSVDNDGLKIIEGADNKYESYRTVSHIAVDSSDDSRRDIFLTPSDRSYKLSQSNRTTISSVGKLGFNTDVAVGIDGYLYYEGVLRKAQRTIDGFESDPETFPGLKAVGAAIELLPPLVKNIRISVDVTTRDGVNVSEITDQIKTVVTNYVLGRAVGEDVILSDIIVAIKELSGVLAVTFIDPTPDTERVSIEDNEKPFITSNDILVT